MEKKNNCCALSLPPVICDKVLCKSYTRLMRKASRKPPMKLATPATRQLNVGFLRDTGAPLRAPRTWKRTSDRLGSADSLDSGWPRAVNCSASKSLTLSQERQLQQVLFPFLFLWDSMLDVLYYVVARALTDILLISLRGVGSLVANLILTSLNLYLIFCLRLCRAADMSEDMSRQ